MSKYAYCCIVTRLISYIKSAQAWEGLAITMDVSKLTTIEQQLYDEYVQLEHLKRQIVNNEELNIDNFKKLVSNEKSIINLCRFYNTKFAGKFSNYYTYCDITPPSEDDHPGPVIPPPNNDPFLNPDNHDLNFNDVVGHLGDVITSNIVIIGNLPVDTDILLYEGGTTLFTYGARCAQTVLELESTDFKEITNKIEVSGKTSSVGTLLVQLQARFTKENIGLDEFILVIDNQSKTWKLEDAEIIVPDTKFKNIYESELNTYTASNIIMTGGFSPNTNIVVNCDGASDGLICACQSAGEAKNRILKKSIILKPNKYGDVYIQAIMHSASTPKTKKDLNVYINGNKYDTWSVATIGYDHKFKFTFEDKLNVDLNTICTSDTITITGIVPNKIISVSAVNGKIDIGTAELSGGFSSLRTVKSSSSGTIVAAAQGISPITHNSIKTVIVTIDDVVGYFNIKTN